MNEADTCRKYVLPKLYAATWSDEQINEQRTFTDGRIVIAGKRPLRRPQKRADYLLRYRRDFPIAIVEAKRRIRIPATGCSRPKSMR
jgi:type I restriction enzyme R subunit